MSWNNLFCLRDDDDVPLMTFFQWSDKTANPATLPLLLVLVLRHQPRIRLEGAASFFNGAGLTTTTTPPPRSSRAPLNKTLNTKYLPFSRSFAHLFSCEFGFGCICERAKFFPSEERASSFFAPTGRVFPHPVCVCCNIAGQQIF